MDYFHQILSYVNLIIEALWVFIIFIWIFIWLFKWIFFLKKSEKIYARIREEIARTILLWLEILIAADIIKTVTTDLTLESTWTLALIVVIRTVLSISLEVEIDKKFPWQNKITK